jgi:predicted metal-dependent peptidase
VTDGDPRGAVSGGTPLRWRRPNEAEERAKVDLLGQLEQDRAQLLLRFPFVARLAMHLELVPVVDSRIPTAATDGHRAWFNPSFIGELTDDERLFVMAHEVWHCALGHIGRGEGHEDEHRWNVAVDHVVNAMLKAEGLTLPKDAVLFDGWEGTFAEDIYEMLAPPEPPEQEERDDDKSDDPYASDEWEPYDLYRLFRPTEVPTDRGRFADVHGAPGADEALRSASAEGGELVLDPDYSPSAPPEPELWNDRMVAAAQQEPGAAAGMGDPLTWRLDPLREPTVPWQEVLRQFVTSAYGGERRWLPPNRRYVAQGLYLPSRRSDLLQVVVAVDTSSSTTEYLGDFASELVGLLQSFGRYELTLICCDEEVRSVREYDADRPLAVDDLQLEGGWGTDFRPVFEWVAANVAQVNVMVFLTDGDGAAPREAPGYPVLWALTPGGDPPATWGRAVRLAGQR